MIVFLIANWRWLIPTTIAAALSLMLGFKTIELDNLKAAQAKAIQIATEAARAKDAQNAQLAINLDQANLEKRDAIEKAADAAHALARTRGMFVRLRADLPSTSPNPGGAQNGTIEARLSDGDAEFLNTFAADCAKDQGVASLGHNWSLKVGK